MTAYYLAARYARRDEMRQVRNALYYLGHSVTASWLNSDDDPTRAPTPAALDRDRHAWAAYAVMDLHDIAAADELLAFTESLGFYSTGGRHVEVGYALALGKPVTLIGDRENIFHCLDQIRHHRSFTGFVEAITAQETRR